MTKRPLHLLPVATPAFITGIPCLPVEIRAALLFGGRVCAQTNGCVSIQRNREIFTEVVLLDGVIHLFLNSRVPH